MEIKISANIGDKFSQGLQEVLSVIDHIHQSKDEEDVLVFQNDFFVTPLFILPLLVYISGCRREANESGNDGEQAAALDGINITRASFAAIQSLKENRWVEVE